jgi:hypothetical protein
MRERKKKWRAPQWIHDGEQRGKDQKNRLDQWSHNDAAQV